MSLRSTIRSMEAAGRRADREAKRRQRELERQRQQLAKMEALERAIYEVQVHENSIDLLRSVHKDCGDTWDWEEARTCHPPVEPVESHTKELMAQAKLEGYRPRLVDKLFRRVERERAKLSIAVEDAKRSAGKEYKDSLREYERAYSDWQATCELAQRILAGEPAAFRKAIEKFGPFDGIDELGKSVSFQIDSSQLVEASLRVAGEEAIPKETKTVLKSGKLSVKQMTKSAFYELYQDYICGCALRVARELFALLPVEMVIVTAMGEMLNTQTGHMEECPILSAAIPRETVDRLNFDLLDPSDAMENFVHRMKFRKTKGFASVESLQLSDLQAVD